MTFLFIIQETMQTHFCSRYIECDNPHKSAAPLSTSDYLMFRWYEHIVQHKKLDIPKPIYTKFIKQYKPNGIGSRLYIRSALLDSDALCVVGTSKQISDVQMYFIYVFGRAENSYMAASI